MNQNCVRTLVLLLPHTNCLCRGVFMFERQMPVKTNVDQDSLAQNGSPGQSRWMWLLLGGCGLVILIGLLRVSRRHESVPAVTSVAATRAGASADVPSVEQAL